MLQVLRLVMVPERSSRTNVIPDGWSSVQSVTFGLAGPSDVKVSNITWRYPTVFMLLNHWFQQEYSCADFTYTSIQLNVGFHCKRHRDKGNMGPSVIKSLGTYVGGILLYWKHDDTFGPLHNLHPSEAEKIDTRRWTKFDGRKAHEVTPFECERLSVVYYQLSTWRQAVGMSMKTIRQLGAKAPGWD